MHTKERLIYAGCALLLLVGIVIGGFYLLKDDHYEKVKASKMDYLERGQGELSSVGSPIMHKDTMLLRKVQSGWVEARVNSMLSDTAGTQESAIVANENLEEANGDGGESDATEATGEVEVTSRPRRTEVGLTNLQKTKPAVVGVENATVSNITNKPTSSAPVNNNTGSGGNTGGGSSTGGGNTGGGSSTSGGNTGGGSSTGGNTGGNTGGSTQPGTPTVNTVTIKNIKHNAVYDKNSQATITFDLEAGSTIVPTSINVNGTDIAVKASASGGYEFIYGVGSQVGEQTLTIKNLKAGNTAYTCSASVVLDVKRDAFSISGVKLDKETLYWSITDNDGSLVSLTLSVSGDGNKVLDKESLDASMVGVPLDKTKLQDGKTYKVEFSGVYKLDTQGKTTQTFSYSAEVTYQANESGGADQGDSPDYSNFIKSVYLEGNKTSFNKNETITLCIDATDFPAIALNNVTISGKIYPVSSSGNGVHKVSVGAGEAIGQNMIIISSINVGDGVDVTVTGKSITYSVLKAIPTGSVSETDNKDGSYTLTVNVTDADSAITSDITVDVFGEDGSSVSSTVINGSTTITVPQNTTYTYKVQTKYDLGDGKQTALELGRGSLTGLKVVDYSDFVKTISVENGNSWFSKNSNVVVKLTANDKHKDVVLNKIVVNGSEYTPSSSANGVHTFTIPTGTTAGSVSLPVTSINVADSTSVALDSTSIRFNVKKSEPSITFVESGDAGQYTLNFTIKDEDGALIESSMIVECVENGQTSNKAFSKSNTTVSLQVSDDSTMNYTVKAAYNLGDGQVNKTYGTGTLDGNTTASDSSLIKSVYVDNTAAYNKGSEVEITITLNDAYKDTVIWFAEIGGIEYIATSSQGGVATFVVPAGSISGNISLPITKVTDGNWDEIPIEGKSANFRVKKAEPSVRSSVQGSNGSYTLSFSTADADNALIASSFYVEYTQDGEVVKRPFTMDNPTVSISVEDNSSIDYTVKASYDLGDGVVEKSFGSGTLKGKVLVDYSNYSSTITVDSNSWLTKGNNVDVTVTVAEEFKSIPINRIVIDGKTYTPYSKVNGVFKFHIPAGNTAGVITLPVTGLNVGDNVDIDLDSSITYKVKKTIPTLEYNVTGSEGNYTLKLTITDPDSAFDTATTVVECRENGVITQKAFDTTTTELPITVPDDSSLLYTVKGTYDLGDGPVNKTYGSNVLDGKVTKAPPTVDNTVLDFKDVKSVTVYKNGTEVETINSIPTDLENYYMKIEPKYAPTLYADVKEFSLSSDGTKLLVTADLENFVMYSGGTEIEDFSHALEYTSSTPSNSAQAFFDSIKNDPSGSFTLPGNLDAKNVTLDSNFVINETFTGTLNGNGYTIYNLPATLFSKVSGGKITNLTIESANVSNNQSFITNTADNRTAFTGIIIKNSSLNGKSDTGGVGALAGTFNGTSTITNCAVIDCNITGWNTIGGITGDMKDAVISKCAVRGTITGTLSGNQNGTRVGGITGWLGTTGEINNCLVDINLIAPDKNGSGGVFGGPMNANAGTVTSTLTKVNTNNRFAFCGSDSATGKVTNSYQVDTGATLNTAAGLTTVSGYDNNFLTSTLGFTADFVELLEVKEVPLFGESSLKDISGYSAGKDIAYYNIIKLAPFISTADAVAVGNSLNGNLGNKKIQSIFAMNSSDKHVVVLDSSTTGSVSAIRVLYEDHSYETFTLTHEEVVGGLVDTYSFNGSIPYHFNKYVLSDDLELQTAIVNLASTYTYADNLKPVYNSDVRQYSYMYTNHIATNLGDFAKRLVGSEYANKSGNQTLKSELVTEITAALPKLLYTYTYLTKHYNFEMGDIDMADLLFFDSEVMSSELSLSSIVDIVGRGNKAMHQSYNLYEGSIAPIVGMSMYPYFEILLSMSGETDYNKWFEDYWGGYVYTQDLIGYAPTAVLRYKIWDNLTDLQGTDSMLLHILSVPRDIQPQLGILTTASQLLISDVNIYYASPTEENINAFRNKFSTIGAYYGRYFGTTLNFVFNAEQNLNDALRVGLDTTQSNKWINPQYNGQAPGVSDAPLAMWIVQPSNHVYVQDSGAVATGKFIYYGFMSALAYESFLTFTHENAHNQDIVYFLNSEGRRANGEYYATGLLAEPSIMANGSGDFTTNRVNTYSIMDDVIFNFSYERINSEAELVDYYKKLFDLWYLTTTAWGNSAINDLDGDDRYYYLVWTREKKYGDDGLGEDLKPREAALDYTYANESYTNLWGVNDWESLWDSKLNFRPMGASGTSYDDEDFWNITWFTPENENGVSDAKSFKFMAYEMLAYYGYYDGFIGWASNRYGNDKAAIQAITGKNSMKEYKLSKYAEANQKLGQFPYLDSERFEALVKQSYFLTPQDRGSRGDVDYGKWTRKIIIQAIKRVTDDFTNGDAYTAPDNIYMVDSASRLVEIVNENARKKGVYIKLTDDIDMSTVSVNTNYFAETFVGILDGQGHKITGLTKPLFKEVKFSIFDDIVFEGNATSLLTTKVQYALTLDCAKAESASFVSGATMDNHQFFEYFTTVPKVEEPVKLMMRLRPSEDDSVSANSVSVNSVSANDVSANSVSGNDLNKEQNNPVEGADDTPIKEPLEESKPDDTDTLGGSTVSSNGIESGLPTEESKTDDSSDENTTLTELPPEDVEVSLNKEISDG